MINLPKYFIENEVSNPCGRFVFLEIFIWTEAVRAVFAKNRGILREKRNTFTVTEYRFYLKSIPLPFTASSKNLYRNTVPQKIFNTATAKAVYRAAVFGNTVPLPTPDWYYHTTGVSDYKVQVFFDLYLKISQKLHLYLIGNPFCLIFRLFSRTCTL